MKYQFKSAMSIKLPPLKKVNNSGRYFIYYLLLGGGIFSCYRIWLSLFSCWMLFWNSLWHLTFNFSFSLSYRDFCFWTNYTRKKFQTHNKRLTVYIMTVIFNKALIYTLFYRQCYMYSKEIAGKYCILLE